MPEEYGGQVSDWSTAKYPGILGATPTTPIALDAQIAALINGGSLSGGDKLARMSDIATIVQANALQLALPAFASNDGKAATMQSLQQKNILTLTPATGVTATRLTAWINAANEFNFNALLLLSASAIPDSFLLPVLSGAPAGPGIVTTAGTAVVPGGFTHSGITYHSLEVTVNAAGVMSIGLASNSTAPMPANTYIALSGRYVLNLSDAV